MSSTTTTYAYNGDGVRASRTTGGVTTSYTWDVQASNPLLLQDGTNTYVWGLGLISATDGSGNTYYYLPNGLGSTIAPVSSTGTVADTYDYDAFGDVTASTGSQANVFKFTGEQADSTTGLEYLRARYYDVDSGAFISRDPIAGNAQQPLSQNRYTYVRDDPASYIDPSGMLPCVSQKTFDKFKGLVFIAKKLRVCDAIAFAAKKVVAFAKDPINQYSAIQFGALALAGVSCPLVWTGVANVACFGAISLYGAAWYGKLNSVCDDVRNLLNVLPLPNPIVSTVAKRALNPVVRQLAPDDLSYGGCQP